MERIVEMERFLSKNKNGGGEGEIKSPVNNAAENIVRAAGDVVDEVKSPVPRRRALALTAFVACLSFLLLVLNIIVSVIRDLVENVDVRTSVLQYLNETGVQRPPVCPPLPPSPPPTPFANITQFNTSDSADVLIG